MTMTTTTKLERIPYGNVCVIHDEQGHYLKSYETIVAFLSHDGWLTIYGLYSATTRKHISAFMREYTSFMYQTAKQCYNDNVRLNIFTGEIIEIENED